MKKLYIDGNLLINTSERVVFNTWTVGASKPEGEVECIEVGETGYYTISDASFSDAAFTDLYVKDYITFVSDLHTISVNHAPKLKPELDGINENILNKLPAGLHLHRLVLMGYFSSFELYLMEMVMSCILFDEKHMNTFIRCLKENKIKGIYNSEAFLSKILDVVDSKTLSDKAIKLKVCIPDMFIYHKFDSIKDFFKKVFNITIPDLKNMKEFYGKYRHDLTHRYGRNKGDQIVYINEELIQNVYKEMVAYSEAFDLLKNQALEIE